MKRIEESWLRMMMMTKGAQSNQDYNDQRESQQSAATESWSWHWGLDVRRQQRRCWGDYMVTLMIILWSFEDHFMIILGSFDDHFTMIWWSFDENFTIILRWPILRQERDMIKCLSWFNSKFQVAKNWNEERTRNIHSMYLAKFVSMNIIKIMMRIMVITMMHLLMMLMMTMMIPRVAWRLNSSERSSLRWAPENTSPTWSSGDNHQ